jgi:signal transduction histidine kinase
MSARATLARLLPRSLFGRVALILFAGLAAAHILSFVLVMYERAQAGNATMIAYLVRDVAGSIAILERTPKDERADWLKLLDRPNYRYALGDRTQDNAAPPAGPAETVLTMLADRLGPRYQVTASASPGVAGPLQLVLHTRLLDGTPLMVELLPPKMSVSPWVAVALTLQLALLGLFTWIAVRIATEPLSRLQRAADALGPDLNGAPLPQDGPNEVARAAAAFNAMQRRIADHLAERTRIVAAISHDLQTPITRMRLRADLLDDDALRRKLHGDLHQMQVLVEQGIDFARGRDKAEPPCPTDLHALLDSLICDYTDAGAKVRLTGAAGAPVTTRPRALRRIVTNLIDNALKFGCEVEVKILQEAPGTIALSVLDRGPGIPDEKLQSVLQPFVRLEESRSRDTGGSGLGLAIAQQLAATLDGTLILSNRVGGGLEAQLSLPRHRTS